MFNKKRTLTAKLNQVMQNSHYGLGLGLEPNRSPFANAALKESSVTVSDNGAKKYSTTGNPFLDQFTNVASYKTPRSFEDISRDCEELWSINQLNTIKFNLYLRMITRKTNNIYGQTTKVAQSGAEMRYEGIMRYIWLYTKNSKAFYENLPILVSVGSWKDIFDMMRYDYVYNGFDNKVLSWKSLTGFILNGLSNENTSELIKKYLPTFKSNVTTIERQANNAIAGYIASELFQSPLKAYKGREKGSILKKYRKLKSSGTAHQWQQLISNRNYKELDFGKIHGRALNKLVNGKFLKNQGLENVYNQFITDDNNQTVKYTGFVHELFEGISSRSNQNELITADKQFMELVNKANPDQTNFIVVRDTSASMRQRATGTNSRCFDVAKSLALYFSYFLKGKFSNSYIEFNSNAKLVEWKGESPTQRYFNDKSSCVGSTDFKSVINLFCKLKRNGLDESEFPTGIICVSDLEFNVSDLKSTNVETAKNKLRNAGFSELFVTNFVIVLWNLASSAKFETFGNTRNVFYFGGYSASVISLLTNKIDTPIELLNNALNQEILQDVII